MSTRLIALLSLCIFSIHASDRFVLQECQQLILRLALPKIGGISGGKSTQTKFLVRVMKKSETLDKDLVGLDLHELRSKKTVGKISLKAKESRDRKERDYRAAWQYANMLQGRCAAQARENFDAMSALYERMPAEEQQDGTLYFKEVTVLLPLSVDEHKNDADRVVFDRHGQPVKNTRKRRLNFDA